ncbi:MAG TPA: triose-phosphate isomerase, partial [Sphingomonas sp.]|nr:triose-phosphate isomerase [Sphingomonas sp.]
VESQVRGSVPRAGADRLVVAYEPIWAIGTGRTPKPEQVAGMHGVIRRTLVDLLGAEGERVRILYGGSVNGDNAARILAVKDVNGALVGGASLTAAAFVPIIEAAREI